MMKNPTRNTLLTAGLAALSLASSHNALAYDPLNYNGVYELECSSAALTANLSIAAMGIDPLNAYVTLNAGCDVNGDDTLIELYSKVVEAQANCVSVKRSYKDTEWGLQHLFDNPQPPEPDWTEVVPDNDAECHAMAVGAGQAVYDARKAMIEFVPDQLTLSVHGTNNFWNWLFNAFQANMLFGMNHEDRLDVSSLLVEEDEFGNITITADYTEANPPASSALIYGVINQSGNISSVGVGVDNLGGAAGNEWFGGCANIGTATLNGDVNAGPSPSAFLNLGANLSFNCIAGASGGALWINGGLTFTGSAN